MDMYLMGVYITRVSHRHAFISIYLTDVCLTGHASHRRACHRRLSHSVCLIGVCLMIVYLWTCISRAYVS
jgi:hypothetical protein